MKKSLMLVVFIIMVQGMRGDIWSEIRDTAVAPNNGPNGRALPLAAAWQTGWYKYNWGDNRGGTMFEPSYIIELIEQQHRLLATLPHFSPTAPTTYLADYAEDALNYLELKDQPIVVCGTQYEQYFYTMEPYISLPPATSPRVYTTNQELLNKVTPFPPVPGDWYDVGVEWIDGSGGMDMLQSLYPAPPKVIFCGNNEAQKLTWLEAESSQRYVDLFGYGQTDNFKRQEFAAGWTGCYSQMLGGMQSALSTNWQNNSIFIGYLNSGPWSFYGRWAGWVNYSLHHGSQMTWEQNAWDGGSASYYLNNGLKDFHVMSPQVGIQNRVFMLADQLADNPDFWHELSVWHGSTDYFTWLDTIGQSYSGDRYKGLVQFGMFMVTPRVVRHFNGWTESREQEGYEYFDAIMDAVDRVHTDPVLKRFWQFGELVENTTRSHPYQIAIPAEFASRSRWFMLNTDLDPALPWSVSTELPVFACARVIGEAPNREWLLYAHSPVQARTGVTITLPGYGNVVTDVSQEGTFVHLRENDNDLIAYYNLNSTAADISGNGNDGTLVNSPGYAAGKIANGISLTKAYSQYVNGGRAAIISSDMEELTVSMWVKADTLQELGLDWILGKGSLYYLPKSGFSLRLWHKQLAFYAVGPNDAMVGVFGPTLEAGVWYHLAGVFKGGEYMKLYVNGVEYTTSATIPPYIAASGTYDLHIGNGSYCSYPWDGIIDEVKIFNRALTRDEITDHAHRLLELDFEAIYAGQVDDLSWNGNYGTLVNTPELTRARVAGNYGIDLLRSASEYVNCGRDASLDGSTELTIDLWANAATLQELGIDWILGKGSLYYNPKCGYSLRLWHKQLAFYVPRPDGTLAGVSGPTLTEGMWYHIVAVFKGGEYLKLIVNGTEYTSTASIPASITPAPTYDLHIGNGSYCSYPWDGVIDAVKIYNKALH